MNIIQYHLALTQSFPVLGKSQYCISKIQAVAKQTAASEFKTQPGLQVSQLK